MVETVASCCGVSTPASMRFRWMATRSSPQFCRPTISHQTMWRAAEAACACTAPWATNNAVTKSRKASGATGRGIVT